MPLDVSCNLPNITFDKPPYWHASGDIPVLVVDNGKEYKFRVHREILSLHHVNWVNTVQTETESDKEAPAESDEEASAESDGEISVVLFDASAKDVCSLLSAIYLGVENIRETRDLDVALAVLRLSHQYEADNLYKAIHNILQESWPLNFVNYFVIPQEQRQRVLSSIKLIKAARATDSTSLFPTALYELATIPQELWTEEAMNLLGELSSEDLTRLFLGKNRIIHRSRAFIAHLYAEHVSDTTYRCCVNRVHLIHEATIEIGQLYKMFMSKYMSCGTCKEWLFRRLKPLMIEIWQSIPVYFNLPSVEMTEVPPVRKVFG